MKTSRPSRPILFSIAVTIGFILFLLAIVIASQLGSSPTTRELFGALGRVLMAAVGLVAMHRLRYPLPGGGIAGVERTREAAGWAWAAVVLLYVLIVYPPLFTGGYAMSRFEPALSSAVAANGLAAGISEEIVFRGLLLGGLLAAWGGARRDLVRSVLLSSALFSLPHLLNLLAGADPLRTLAQLVWAFFLGCVFAGLVIVSRTLWPAAVVHGLGNALLHVQRLGQESPPDPVTALWMAVAPIPLVFGTIVLIRRTYRTAEVG